MKNRDNIFFYLSLNTILTKHLLQKSKNLFQNTCLFFNPLRTKNVKDLICMYSF